MIKIKNCTFKVHGDKLILKETNKNSLIKSTIEYSFKIKDEYYIEELNALF